MTLVASARMYGVTPRARAAWRQLFEVVAERSGIALEIIEHAFPAPLSDLWGRPDLGAGFMCGWPFALAGSRHQLVAAPIVDDPAGGGRAVYRTHFVVRADAPAQRLVDTFGGRLAFTVPDSHSGYNAPRHHLLPFRLARAGAPLFRQTIGPLVTPRRVIDAIMAGDADVGPLDSYALALMMADEPELASQIRVIDSTAWARMPAIVAAPDTDPDAVARLSSAFLAMAADEPVMRDLRLSGFLRPPPAVYRLTEQWAEEAEAAGLPTLA